jgi:secreted trypsin-like serine protease
MFFHLSIGSGGQTCAKIPSWMKNAISNRIINGEFVPSPIPWQIRMTAGFSGFSQLCGGTILDEETILTAAHCFFDAESGKIIQK